MLAKISERREQLEQQLLDIEQMKLELDTAEERCVQALEQTIKSQQAVSSQHWRPCGSEPARDCMSVIQH